ncbi:retention module-containing protein, partial [Amphritea opalescens]
MENVEAAKGTVVSVSGEVVVVDSKGVERVLQSGEQVNPGDMVIVPANSQAEIDLGKAEPETVPADTTAILEVDPTTGEISLVFHSVNAETLDVADIQAAILAGQDPTQILEETAAGNTPPTSSGFSEFQAVDRTAEEVLARAGYDTNPENWEREPYVDDEGELFVLPSEYSVADVSVSEGGLMTFTVTRTGGTSEETIDFSTGIDAIDNAEANDFTSTAGTLTFATGETSKTFTVQTTQDDVLEGKESFSVNLSNPSGNGQIVDGTATGIIIDDGTGSGPDPDNDTPVISIADASMEEGSTLTFNATLTGSSAIAYDVDLALSESNPASATAGTDYTNAMTVTVVGGTNDGDTLTLNGSTVTVPADATGLTIAVDTTDDAVYEGDETFSIS